MTVSSTPISKDMSLLFFDTRLDLTAGDDKVYQIAVENLQNHLSNFLGREIYTYPAFKTYGYVYNSIPEGFNTLLSEDACRILFSTNNQRTPIYWVNKKRESIPNEVRNTIIQWHVFHGKIEALPLFLHMDKSETASCMTEETLRVALHLAIRREDADLVQQLLDCPNARVTWQMISFSQDKQEILELLNRHPSNNQNINNGNEQDERKLYRNEDVFEQILNCKYDVFLKQWGIFLKNEGDVNSRDNQGNTFLHRTILSLDSWLSPQYTNKIDEEDSGCITITNKERLKEIKTIRSILKRSGVNPALVNKEGKTAYQIALEMKSKIETKKAWTKQWVVLPLSLVIVTVGLPIIFLSGLDSALSLCNESLFSSWNQLFSVSSSLRQRIVSLALIAIEITLILIMQTTMITTAIILIPCAYIIDFFLEQILRRNDTLAVAINLDQGKLSELVSIVLNVHKEQHYFDLLIQEIDEILREDTTGVVGNWSRGGGVSQYLDNQGIVLPTTESMASMNGSLLDPITLTSLVN